MELAFDTETTGLFDYKKDLADPSQPRIIELGAVIGKEGEVIEEYQTLIKPDGWIVTQEITNITGITTEMCEADGIPIMDAVKHIEEMAKKCSLSVAHNMSFDMAMYNRETVPVGMTRTYLRDLPRFCTMKRDERFKGRGFPRKLGDLHCHLFGCSHEDKHRALSDAKATLRCYYDLIKQPCALEKAKAVDDHGLKPLLF